MYYQNIVEEAKKQRDTLAKNAEGKAQQEINMKQRIWQQKLDAENQAVSKSDLEYRRNIVFYLK